jgi:hypothetical protein
MAADVAGFCGWRDAAGSVWLGGCGRGSGDIAASLFWTGDTLSALGSALSVAAAPILAYSVLHASPGEPGVIKAAQTLPFLIFAIPIGEYAGKLGMIGRPDTRPTWWLGLQMPIPASSGGMLCGRAVVESTDTSHTIRPILSYVPWSGESPGFGDDPSPAWRQISERTGYRRRRLTCLT